MKFIFFNTSCVPIFNYISKIDYINRKVIKKNKDFDAIFLQEFFKWRIGILSIILLPLALKTKKYSNIFFGLSFIDGNLYISNILFVLYILHKLKKDSKKL